ncbi:MAG: type I-E CRISPR-associated protein Cas7/Cse4/CasC [Planctomycetia bacterium]|nr:type I-E CRISPR-associated protein Cas7/Cse4/CasC [Planctomycetia bacterium]
MFVELHMLQNFAPSCLNRDDTNSPKDCEFGGYRRARISSQCLKRAIRDTFGKSKLMKSDELATRSKRFVGELERRLIKDHQTPPSTARSAAINALAAADIRLAKAKGGDDSEQVVELKTEYLLFLGDSELAAIVGLIVKHLDHIGSDAVTNGVAAAQKESDAKKRMPKVKKAVGDEIYKAMRETLDGGKAADLALFGRMLANIPEKNVSASCQVAHALSTNKVNMEMDFYTAVDDLKPEDSAGADMLGTVEFNSACFYRYANIDCDALLKNLHGDEDLTRKTIKAFLNASRSAIPTGKQNSSAAHNEPSFVFAVVRQSGLQSLANAFVKPARPSREDGVDKSLICNSIEAADKFWGRVTSAYGEEGIVAKSYVECLAEDPELPILAKSKAANFDTLVKTVLDNVSFGQKGK